MNIEGSVAVITGASGGIGRAVAVDLAKRGAKGMAMVDRTESILEVVKAVNDETGTKGAVGYAGDVTDPEFRRNVYADMQKKFGPVNICVPAAGITRDRLAVRIAKETHQVAMYPLEMFREVVEVNLIAPVYWGLEMVAGIALER
ncbi:MAG TPA: SDR family NAD(P)-dependent oxidoreductase, partial [Verrucomicrobiae bacterium]